MSTQLEEMKRKPQKMTAKDAGMEYWFENVVVSFPHLDEPTVHPDWPESAPRYSITVILKPDEALKFTEKVKEHIEKNNLPMPNPFVFEAFNIKSLDDKKHASEPRLYNNFARIVYNGFPVTVGKIENNHLITIEKHKVKEEIPAGCICLVQVKVKLRNDERAKEGEYSMFVNQVIKVAEGEPMGGAPPSLGQGLDMSQYGITEINADSPAPSMPAANEEMVYDYKVPSQGAQKAVEAQMEDLIK